MSNKHDDPESTFFVTLLILPFIAAALAPYILWSALDQHGFSRGFKATVTIASSLVVALVWATLGWVFGLAGMAAMGLGSLASLFWFAWRMERAAEKEDQEKVDPSSPRWHFS